MKKIITSRYAPLILPIIEIMITIVVYPNLPNNVPMQFSFSGQVNWSLPKIYGAWFFPAITLGITLYNVYFKPDTSKGAIWLYSLSLFVLTTGVLLFIVMMY